ncbi:F-box/FBD/LRR-repeat protein At1g13570-like isoform X3 [Rutidosis leptorrhynchoides]|uniref:F-box/FBD/LRR-repeat protein At1g13570-like isoform X3 n=1 Tax=Rutidosis leptorrhynchoides TaxID=125765 RepID=UPI003A99DD21
MDSSLILKLGKRKRRMRAEKDRLSRLPEYLIDSILERVPVEDAVRTSVLSRNWRYRWTRMRSLILDEHFSEKLARNGGAFGYNGFIRITNQLFNFLEGPILNVHLHIPKNMVVDNFQEVNQWIFSLSRKHNGVRELVLTNSNKVPYQLPSYLFHCSELRKLHLKNCIFKPPSPFDDLNNGFPHLNDLSLSNITFEANLGETVFELPGLEKLELSLCTNVCNFNIKATKLKSLTVEGCHDVKFIRLLDSQRLTDVHLFITEPIPIPRFEERVNLATMLSNLPYLVSLSADGCFLKYSVGEKIPKWLPCAAAANRLLHRLYFIDCNFGQLDQIQGALLLLRNSPNLELLIVMNVCLTSSRNKSALAVDKAFT